MHLTRSAIAVAALSILDEYGLGDVSMRRVAAELGVAPGALYWHIENKQALIAAMAELICQPVIDADYRGPHEFSSTLRAALLAHRDGADVVSTAAAQPDSSLFTSLTDVAREGLAQFRSPTVTDDLADAAASALVYLTLGAAHIHQSAAQLSEATDDTSSADSDKGAAEEVEKAIALLLAGFAAR